VLLGSGRIIWMGLGNSSRRITMREMILQFILDVAGVTAIEYGLIAALVAVICIAAWSLLGTNLSTIFNNIAGSV
jgi:pilus assembly protein Flp/PilA